MPDIDIIDVNEAINLLCAYSFQGGCYLTKEQSRRLGAAKLYMPTLEHSQDWDIFYTGVLEGALTGKTESYEHLYARDENGTRKAVVIDWSMPCIEMVPDMVHRMVDLEVGGLRRQPSRGEWGLDSVEILGSAVAIVLVQCEDDGGGA